MPIVIRGLRAVLFTLIVALVISVLMGVFWRYALQQSLFWATEVPNFMFVWIVFLGSVVAFHEKKHIAFTALVDALPERLRSCVEIGVMLLIVGFCGFLVVTGSMVSWQTMGSQSEALKMPLGIFYAVLPLTGLLMGLDAVNLLVERIRSPRPAGGPA